MTEFEKEWAKMLNGEIYKATDSEFLGLLAVTRDTLWEFNHLRPSAVSYTHLRAHETY